MEGDHFHQRRHISEHAISIHALRVEGDAAVAEPAAVLAISIHALRVEGDHELEDLFFGLWISIHALRVEGDSGFLSVS